MRLLDAEITYCTNCTYEATVAGLVLGLAQAFGPRVRSITLRGDRGGVLEVVANGQLVHSKRATRQMPVAEDVVTKVRVILGE